jgi:hypothetical protein
MCIVSFDKALNITIHNQYSGLELTSPVYFSTNTTHYVPPSQQTNTGNIVETSFGIDSKQKDLKFVSLYKLQRKYTTETDNRPDNSTASIESTATNIYLLVAWIARDYDHKFCAYLIEFTDDFAWDEDKLWSLYREYNDQFHMSYEPRIIRWLMNDNAVMKMKLAVSYGLDYKLDIVLSEGVRRDSVKEPMKIDPKRLVLTLSMLIMLTYAVRLTIRPSFKLNIHNQCLNVDLVSPTCITGEELDCHRSPDYNVGTNDIMRSAFIIRWTNASYGILIYKLKKKQPHGYTETDEDTSNITTKDLIGKMIV